MLCKIFVLLFLHPWWVCSFSPFCGFHWMKEGGRVTVQICPELEIVVEYSLLYRTQLFSEAGWSLSWFIPMSCTGIYWEVKYSTPLNYKEIWTVDNRLFHENAMLIIPWVIHIAFISFYNLHQYFSFCLQTNKRKKQWKILFKLLITSGFKENCQAHNSTGKDGVCISNVLLSSEF